MRMILTAVLSLTAFIALSASAASASVSTAIDTAPERSRPRQTTAVIITGLPVSLDQFRAGFVPGTPCDPKTGDTALLRALAKLCQG